MEFKKTNNRNIVPSLSKQKNMCKRYFDTASYLYKKYKLHHRPERIFAVSLHSHSIHVSKSWSLCPLSTRTRPCHNSSPAGARGSIGRNTGRIHSGVCFSGRSRSPSVCDVQGMLSWHWTVILRVENLPTVIYLSLLCLYLCLFLQGQRVKLTSARSVYPDAFFTCSYTGRVTDLVMLWWFRDHFLKKVCNAKEVKTCQPRQLFVCPRDTFVWDSQ